MSEVEKLIESVAEKSGKSLEDIRAMMEKRKEATHGLLSDYGAIYAVAKEFGVGFSNEKMTITAISDVELQKAYNVAGRVTAVYPAREFTRKDGSKGRFSSILLKDGSGEIRLTLWDANSETAEKVSKGDCVLAKNVYGKPGLGDEKELHATSLSNIEINPELEVKLPELKESLVKIKDLKADMKSVDVLCRVSSYYPAKEFTRSDGSVGCRAAFTAEDETGAIRAVLWDEAAKQEISEGSVVRIENGYTRSGMNEEIELQVGNAGRVVKTDEKLDLPEIKEEKIKISDIMPDMPSISVVGRVMQVYPQRAYTNGVMSSIVLGDASGVIRVVLWNEKSEISTELKRGDAVKIKNAYSKKGLGEGQEIHVGKYTDVIVNPDLKVAPIEKIEKNMVTEKNIIDLENNDSYILIRGTIVDLNDRRRPTYMTCPYCNKKLQTDGVSYFCEACNQEVEPTYNLILSFTVEDDTGSIRAIAFRENAEKILDMDVEELMNLSGEAGDETMPITAAKERLISQEIALVGRIRYNDFSDQLEFIVDEVM